MRKAIIALALTMGLSPATAATISDTEASAHIGQDVTVRGTVSEVHTARSGKATFIDMGGNYPNEDFTAVIFARSMSAVGDVSGLTGKTVEITGTVQSYEGRPEIIVSSREQIKMK